jgi:hypothetical protein
MNKSRVPNFMLLTSTSPQGGEWLINLDQVRMIDQISHQGIRLVFSEQHMINLTGPAVKDVMTLVANNCIVVDGTPLPEVMERFRSQSPSSGQSPGLPPKA